MKKKRRHGFFSLSTSLVAFKISIRKMTKGILPRPKHHSEERNNVKRKVGIEEVKKLCKIIKQQKKEKH